MHRAPTAFIVLALASSGCITPPSHWADVDAEQERVLSEPRPTVSGTGTPPAPRKLQRVERPRWEQGQLVLQGFFGAGYVDNVSLEGSSSDVQIDSDEYSNLPVIGGGGQWKLGGNSVDFGLELMFSVAWRANAIAFASSGGGAVVAVDVDTLLVDVFGGPFVSVFLGPDFRIYAAVGPTLQFVDYTQNDPAGDIDGFGSGWGAYARGGFEFRLPNNRVLGLSARRNEADVDLGSDVGTFNVDSTQVVLTVTSGF
jgi:hypothetical protein